MTRQSRTGLSSVIKKRKREHVRNLHQAHASSERSMEAAPPSARLGTGTFCSGGGPIQEHSHQRRTRHSRKHWFRRYHLPQFLQHHESLNRGHNARHAGASPPPQASAVDAEPWHAAPGQDDPVVGDPQHGVPASGTGTSFPLGDLVVDVQGQLEDRGTRLGDARVQSLDLDQAGEELGSGPKSTGGRKRARAVPRMAMVRRTE